MFGIFKRTVNKWKWKGIYDIDPDSIFLDSKNLPDFNTHQFEGRLEKPISKNIFSIFSSACLLVAIIFLLKFGSLQIVHGEEYRNKSENNKLRQILIVAPRGTIYSREGVELAYNKIEENKNDFSLRKYVERLGFSHLLGFVKYPAKDKAGFYYEEEFLPKDAAELYLNEALAGKNGLKLIETSVDGEVVSQSVIEPPKSGEDITLSIDARIQEELYKNINELSGSVGFQGGAGIIMDVHSGEILALASFPEYDSNIMTDGSDMQKIEAYFKDPNNPFLNRAISGLYTPGSIVKPFLAFAALEEAEASR